MAVVRARVRRRRERAAGALICVDCGIEVPSRRRTRCPPCAREADLAWRRTRDRRLRAEAKARELDRLEGDGPIF